MSENGIHIGIDRRVARTRMLLAEALMALGAARGMAVQRFAALIAAQNKR